MDNVYYVASLRGSGWFGRSSQFDTRLDQAKEFNYDGALELCRKFKGLGHVLVPVRKSDMEAI